MSEIKDETTLATLIGVNKMSEVQQADFMERVGNIVIEASVGRLLLTLEADQVSKIENYLQLVGDNEDVFAYLLRTYPDFQSIVEKEAMALRREAEEVFVK